MYVSRINEFDNKILCVLSNSKSKVRSSQVCMFIFFHINCTNNLHQSEALSNQLLLSAVFRQGTGGNDSGMHGDVENEYRCFGILQSICIPLENE